MYVILDMTDRHHENWPIGVFSNRQAACKAMRHYYEVEPSPGSKLYLIKYDLNAPSMGIPTDIMVGGEWVRGGEGA
jgi:hypothetical protein